MAIVSLLKPNTKLVYQDGVPVGVQASPATLPVIGSSSKTSCDSHRRWRRSANWPWRGHDFNNLLTAINGYSGWRSSALMTTTLRSYLVEIKKAGIGPPNLTRNCWLSGASRFSAVADHLNDVVTDMTKLLRRLIGEDVKLAANSTSS